jgi:glycosyltransferase involved in cell wall biosynthesis
VRGELGIPEGSFVFGSAGRLVAQKNQSFLLRAFAEAFPSDGGEALLLVGEGPDRGMLERLVDELGLAPRVKMLGRRDDMGALYAAMDCFCLPSTYEGLGIVAVEAQISGAQTLISTEVPCDAEVTLGARYVPLDADAWARSMRLVREQGGPRGDAAEMGAFAPYDIDSAAPLLLEYYRAAVDGVR